MTPTLDEPTIRAVLDLLCDYCTWMYYGNGAVSFRRSGGQHITHDGHSFRISVQDDGLFLVTREDGKRGVYDTSFVTVAPVNGSLVNGASKVRLVNEADLDEADRPWFREVAIFTQSGFQRSIAFTFLAHMEAVTRAGIAADLARAAKWEPPTT